MLAVMLFSNFCTDEVVVAVVAVVPVVDAIIVDVNVFGLVEVVEIVV